MTAYRQRALACAAVLCGKPGRPLDLRSIAPDAGAILRRNVHGRFERSERGVYHLTGLGEAARKHWTGDGAATE